MIQASLIFLTLVCGTLESSSAKKTIHIIPHSHDDVGWLKTLDQYFDGAEKGIQWTSVSDTISSVIDSLLQNPARRFVQIEMKFFSMWFYRQNEYRRNQVRSLVKSGQLEMANAGWSMHDEACPNYEDMINNHMIGHDFVLKEFGVKPRIGWQIDPFGHSNTNARLFADMGFDAWFFGRMDEQDYQKRIKNKELQWIWMPNGDSSKKIFTHKMWIAYGWTPLDKFDITLNNRPFISNQKSKSFNGEEFAEWFISNITDMMAAYRSTEHVFLQWGDDFAYINGFGDFTNLDRMIKQINMLYPDNFTLRYSTPSEYIDAIAQENITWPTKYDDLFPYSDHTGNSEIKSDFWTGYFSSKANSKGYIRKASSFTHASNALFTERVLAQDSSNDEIKNNIVMKNVLLDAMGITQHHDAVTGTAKTAVEKNYGFILDRAIQFTTDYYSKIVGDKVRDQTGYEVKDNKWMQCKKTNLTFLDCPVAMTSKQAQPQFSMAVAVHNPSSQAQGSFRMLVPRGQYKVQMFSSKDRSLTAVNTSMLCHLDLDEKYNQVDSCSLEVFATEFYLLNPKEITLFEITRVSNEFVSSVSQDDTLKIANGDTIAQFVDLDSQNGVLRFNVRNDKLALNESVEINLKYWKSKANFNSWESSQDSGAYIFMSEYGQYEALPYTSLIQKTKVTDDTFIFNLGYMNEDEEMSHEANITVRFYKHADNKVYFKVDVDLFSLPDASYGGHEVVVEFSSIGLNNKGTFYTDANGLDMQERVLNYRPTWNIQDNYDNSTVNVSANFYPVTSAISIRDEKKTFTVMNDRSQAGTSLENGKIQLMQNRRIYSDDMRGVSEPLNQIDDEGRGIRIKATYYAELALNGSVSYQRALQSIIDEPAQVFYGFGLDKTKGRPHHSNLSASLQAAGVQYPVKLITFPTWRNKFTVRLENLNEMGKKATVDLRAIGEAYWNEANLKYPRAIANITIEELSITGNMKITEMQERKIKWKTVDDDMLTDPVVEDQSNDVMDLNPMQIRTFSISIEPTMTEVETATTEIQSETFMLI